MNNYQKAVMNSYRKFIDVFVNQYGYSESFVFKLNYNSVDIYTNKITLGWALLEELKSITDLNNTGWQISSKDGHLIITINK